MITAHQIRAARGLLGWTQVLLAYKAGVALPTVKNAEWGKDVRVSTMVKIMNAFKEGGIRFTAPDEGGGAGVRFR